MPSSTWSPHVDATHLYFITTKAVQYAHIFQRDVIKRILVDSLNTGRILAQYNLFGFVIMPNHVHVILRCNPDYTPSDVIREFKKSTSNLIIRGGFVTRRVMATERRTQDGNSGKYPGRG